MVIEKKKGLRGLKIPKRRLSLVFAVGRKGKAKKMCVFYIPPYFLKHPFTTTPPKMRKRNLHHFLNLCVPVLKTQNFET